MSGDEAFPAVQAAVTVVILLVLAGLVGFLVRQSHRRRRAMVDQHHRTVDSLPEDLRGRSRYAVPLLFAQFPAMYAGFYVGGELGGNAGGLIGLFAGLAPVMALVFHRESRHRAAIADRAVRHAATMDRERLREFVVALEIAHDVPSMRRVRAQLDNRP